MIELAPKHKYGLPIQHPVMPAAGVFGFGNEYHDLIDETVLGAVVTNPVSLHARKAARGPRFMTHGDHFLVHTGLPNPGLKRVLKEHRATWARRSLPTIVHLIATTPPEVAQAAQLLSGIQGVAGLELGLDDGAEVEAACAFLEAAREGHHPILVRIPFGDIYPLAEALAECGADALTLTAPPRARLPLAPDTEHDTEGLLLAKGRLYGPALMPLLLHQLARWIPRLAVPVVACGGITTTDAARACLELGAAAVQIDAVMWKRPNLLTEIAKELSNE
ncbi:MAG: hypothetical protein JXB35_05860 [Anaerolineae bacterium]|nr:hypothetical protein [Anaerolineae bacterium]